MNTDPNQQILSRLARLERSNRRLKLTLAACGVALTGALYMGAASPADKVVKAESIQLVDTEGKLRAAFGSDKDGTFFFMNDQNGKIRAAIAAQAVGSYMNLKDAENNTRAIISYDEEGPALRLRDGNSLAVFAWDKDGPLMHLQREDGRSRFLTPTSDAVVDPEPPQQQQPPQQQTPPPPPNGNPGPIGPRR